MLKRLAILGGLLVLAGAGWLLLRDQPTHSFAKPADLGPIPEPVTMGDFTYRVPEQGDPDYDDYIEMINHPRFSRFNQQGAPQYYDPEWRAEVTGRREVPINDLTLVGGGTSTHELAKFLLYALGEEDKESINDLRVSKDEYQLLCWPEFPNSRPYMRIPMDEAWTMHFASMRKGGVKLFRDWAGKNLELIEVKTGQKDAFTNFDLIKDVDLVVRDVDTDETQVLRSIESVVFCRGTYKVFMFRD